MRTLSTEFEAKTLTLRGEEPISLLTITPVGGSTIYLADKDITVAGQAYEGRIVTLASIQTLSRVNGSGTVSVSSVSLSDADGAMKQLYDTSDLEGASVSVYQVWGGLDEALLILDGRIAAPVSWVEDTRLLNLQIESRLTDVQIGSLAYEDGPMIPLVFGEGIRVPTVEASASYTGSLAELLVGTDMPTTFVVNGGSDFPQNETIDIVVYGSAFSLIHEGVFDGDEFTPSVVNKAYYTSVVFAERPLSDTDRFDASIAWLADSSISLVGLYCYIDYDDGFTQLKTINLCTRQEGAKCWFAKVWRNDSTGDTGTLLDSSHELEEVCPFPSLRWDVDYAVYWFVIDAPPAPISYSGGSWISRDAWGSPAGSKVFSQSVGADYIVSDIESDTIHEVMAYRKVEETDSEPTLVPIPSHYYTLATDAEDRTHVELPLRLSLRPREGWSDTVYVTSTSTVTGNAALIIDYLLQRYLSSSIDATNLDAVSTLMANYPCDFALLKQDDALAVVNEIARQARCVLLRRGSVFTITYLSHEVDSTQDYDESSIQLRSMVAATTATNDRKTSYKITWHPDYSIDPAEFELTNNIDRHGTIEQSEDYYIFGHGYLVRQSVAFWLWRYSNSWRTVSFNTFLNTLAVEGYDTNAIDAALYSDNVIRGTVEEVSIDTATGVSQVQLLLASMSGDADSLDQPVETPSFWTGHPDYPVLATDTLPASLVTGRAQQDYDITPWPEKVDESNKDTDTRAKIIFASVPTSVERGVDFSISLQAYDQQGMRIGFTGLVSLILFSSDTSDVLSMTTVTVSNGSYTGNLQITGGTGSDQFSLSLAATTRYTSESSALVPISPTGEASFDQFPTLAVRGSAFPVTIRWGTASAAIGVSLGISTDDLLYDQATDLEITSVTLSASGTYEGNWYIQDGEGDAIFSIALDDVRGIDSPNATLIGLDGLAYLAAAQEFTKAQWSKTVTLTYASSIEIDLEASNNFVVTLTGDTTFANPVNVNVGQNGTIEVRHQTTGRTISYGTNWRFQDGTEPVLSAAAGIDLLTYHVLSDSTILITLSQRGLVA